MSNLDEDYGFFEDNFDKGLEEQKKAGGSSGPRIPLIYMYEEGTYTFRLYPENYKGAPRWMRHLWYNKLHGWNRVISTKEDKRVDTLCEEYEKLGLKSRKNGAWLHKTQKQGIMMAYLIKAPKKYKEHEGKAVCLVLNWQHMQGWSSFEENYDEDDMGFSYREFLHPMKEAPGIKMSVEIEQGATKKTHVNVSATRSTYDLPSLRESLPEGVEFKGLDYLYVSTESVLTDKLFEEFKAHLDSELSKLQAHQSQNQYNPPADNDGMGGGYVPQSNRIENEDDLSLEDEGVFEGASKIAGA